MTDEPPLATERGILVPRRRPLHRNEEFDELGCEMLLQMQREHFWYFGRHALLLNVLRTEVARHGESGKVLRAIDLGGGCGGWLEFLHTRHPRMFQELALGDSSYRALTLAQPVVGAFATRYQVDLLDLGWRDEWDVVFLLDVLEHIEDHEEVLRQVRASLRPGGLLFVTSPALRLFWTCNDDLSLHRRRYSKRDLRDLSERTQLEALRLEYFMFLLSPALWFSRILYRPTKAATPVQQRDYLARMHRVPPRPLNWLLKRVLSVEGALVDWVSFPWGSSILAVFRR